MRSRVKRAVGFIIIITALAVLSLCTAACGDVGALIEDDMVFASDGNGGAVLIRVEGYYGKDAVIPVVSPDGEPVIGIASEAFAGSGVISVTVPDGVKYIEERAFASCSSLANINIPESVTDIGERAFEGCVSLSRLTVSEGNPVYRSEGNCVILRESGVLAFGCAGSVIPNGISAIGGGAFYGMSSLGTAMIPEGVVSIGDSAFYGCSGLSDIYLPQSLECVGSYAFNGCSSVASVEISPRITVLNEGVFRNCTALVTVTMPEGLTEIDDLAFQGCSALDSPVFPSTLERIGDLAFSGCNAIVHVKFPKVFSQLGDGAFSYCDMFWGIKVDEDNPVFRAVSNCLIRRDDGMVVLGTRGSEIPNDETVTGIADRAFFSARMLRKVVIPSNIKTVGREAFYGCDYLETVEICDGVESVGDGAFVNCFTLHTVRISKSVTAMGSGAFKGCTALTEIRIDGGSALDGWKSDWNGSGANVKDDTDGAADAEK